MEGTHTEARGMRRNKPSRNPVLVTHNQGANIMRGKRFIGMVTLLVAALVLVGTGQAWAVGTASDVTISNKASVTFTINAKTTSVDSNTETFEVDRKIRPVVDWQDTANVSVIAGANDFALKFWVTNESNTAAGSDYFKLTVQEDSEDFPLANVRVYFDVNGNGTFDIGTDDVTDYKDAIVSISNNSTANANRATYFIVANVPTTDPDAYIAGKLSSVHLVATAWADSGLDGDGALTGFAYGSASNNQLSVENVYADDAGSATDDDAYEGQHSDKGTYMVATPIAVTKDVGNGASGYQIPGDTVTYSITVGNTDTVYDATDVVIYDQIPDNVLFEGTLTCPAGFTAYYSESAKGTAPASIVWSTTNAGATVNHLKCGTGAGGDGTIAKAVAAGTPTEVTMSFKVTIQ